MVLATSCSFYYNMAKKTSVVFRSGVKERATMQVNILEAKTNLPNLVRLVETGRKDMITIARYGKPVANIVIFNDVPVSMRIGVARGRLKSPADLDQYNDEVAAMFGDMP
jgi:antitoxin (DNA-binding transcriptional repressor) of toxin-antitoxin stability system